MVLRLFNTASQKIEDFVPIRKNEVGMYCCGLTVYFYTHIGNLRAYTNSDILRRTLEYLGFRVKQVMNITDVGHMTSDEDEGEDKIEVRAQQERKSPWEIARFYEDYFLKSLSRLNILRPSIICRATEHIDDMISLIKRLEERGYTYRTSVGIIFDTAKFPNYSKFANLDLQGQQAGFRVAIDPERKSPWDFALWVTNQPNHIMQWDSPWGRGFPGWHIECSAMSMKYLGEEIDIHTGGIDHIKVHHTNEIAQSEAATGKRFVRYWFHTQFLNVDGQKMSKSIGNLYTVDDLIQRGFHPLALRYFFLGSSYRKPANFTWEALASAQKTLVRCWERAKDLPEPSGEVMKSPITRFEEAITDDLNTARALSIMLEVLDAKGEPNQIAHTLYIMDQILGLDLLNGSTRLEELKSIQVKSIENEKQAYSIAEQREILRREKKFAQADLLRAEILKLGFIVEDTPDGPRLRPRGPES